MSLSRKRRKELKKLKGSAADLWDSQQDVLNHANEVAREVSRQLGNFSKEQVAPVVRDTYEHRVVPTVDRGIKYSRNAVDGVKHGISHGVVPAVGGVVGTVLSIGDIAKDTRVQSALRRLHVPEQVLPAKKGAGAGTVIAIGLGVLAAAGVAYAVWQTFRADDELWVSDEEPAAS
ncbi:DNA helicase [Plantibacter sp. VKM Ac-2880]|jgi:hypothetical protein|uniref:hypothetical protein n=1 Tax=unclassified Plantibacter TaxID=2624265 RepID=UPI0006F6C137|nr:MULTISPECIES: hypothetical protein [unclassified Plantibacter]KQM16712.1 hypothetical protein ASE44_13115 [Plantibacter sp. Leaf1]KQQ52815.1 hypothetical protein ASF68_11120 [Plantibacter sp. Leaf314]KQR59848.1 hypothetical protein ASF83_13105 [Plantibacter sp. Leaf171]MBF4567296.1 DNA helicase [Plantibacter sp. VKM Ac-2880]